MTKEKRIEIKENRKNVKQNNKGSNYERGIICTGVRKGLFITEKNMLINPLYSWILLAHFHKPIINWLRRKLTEQN